MTDNPHSIEVLTEIRARLIERQQEILKGAGEIGTQISDIEDAMRKLSPNQAVEQVPPQESAR